MILWHVDDITDMVIFISNIFLNYCFETIAICHMTLWRERRRGTTKFTPSCINHISDPTKKFQKMFLNSYGKFPTIYFWSGFSIFDNNTLDDIFNKISKTLESNWTISVCSNLKATQSAVAIMEEQLQQVRTKKDRLNLGRLILNEESNRLYLLFNI